MPHGLPDFWQGTIAGMPAIGAGQVAWYMSDAELVGGGGHKDLINYGVPDLFELHVCSGVVSCDFPMHQSYDLRQTPAATWISPTSHIDAEAAWEYPEQAYDGNVQAGAITSVAPGAYTSPLDLLVNETYINKVRFYVASAGIYQLPVDVDVYYEGGWHHVYEGVVGDKIWVAKSIPDGTELVSKARFRRFNSYEIVKATNIYEFQFNTYEVAPQEGIWFDTHSIIPYLPQAPYIVEPGATFAVRVNNADEVAHNMSVALAGFLQKKTM